MVVEVVASKMIRDGRRSLQSELVLHRQAIDDRLGVLRSDDQIVDVHTYHYFIMVSLMSHPYVCLCLRGEETESTIWVTDHIRNLSHRCNPLDFSPYSARSISKMCPPSNPNGANSGPAMMYTFSFV
jgi:hypothetical protein